MVRIFCVILTFAICSAGFGLGIVGQNCDSDGKFIVSDFEVSPYPPTSGVQMIANMRGTFATKEYVSDISVRTSYNRGSWSYKYTDIDENFSYGQIFTFSFPITAGLKNGTYVVETFLERSQGSHISCWTFNYSI